ncbi:MAG: hypothetical protein Sapg2KO_49510 [Saprospiraceae bacterium]
MENSTFYKQLIFISAPTAVAVYFIHQIPALQEHLSLGWISLGFFIGLSVFMFLVGKRAAASENKNNFTNAFLIFLMLKLFLCASLMIGYLKIFEPETKLFILPFFSLYIIYTIFEVFFLIKLGKTQNKAKEVMTS